jgi:hypothetical protein
MANLGNQQKPMDMVNLKKSKKSQSMYSGYWPSFAEDAVVEMSCWR